MFIALWASLKLAEEEGFGVCLRQPQPLRRYTPSHEPPVDSPQGCLCGGSPSTGFESLLLLSAEKEFLPDGYYFVGWISKLAGYVRVSTNTYVYGIRRGFALLVTDVAL